MGNENLIALSWIKTSHHTAQDSMHSHSDDSCNTFPYFLHECIAVFFFFKGIYICCFLTCRENSIMPPFIIAAFRISSGLFEIQFEIKLMEHLTFLLCRHTSQSVAPLRPRTRCFIWHAVWKKMCQVIRATCHFTAKANLSKWDLARYVLKFVDEAGLELGNCSFYIRCICVIRNMVYPGDAIKGLLNSICHLISTHCLILGTTVEM